MLSISTSRRNLVKFTRRSLATGKEACNDGLLGNPT